MTVADAPPVAATLDLAAPPSAVATTSRTVAIGVFDGVHRGHRELLGRLRRSAHRCGADPTVLTFHPHPGAVVGKGEPPSALCSLRRRIQLLEATGQIDECIVLPFTADVAGLEPEAFVEEVLVRRLGARHVLVGANFQFGRGRAGDLATLADLGDRHGFSVEVAGLDPLVSGGARPHLSSTLIRERLAEGDVAFARWALSRPHEVEGWPSPLAAPTALRTLVIRPSPGACMPHPGRYAARLRWRGLTGSVTEVEVADNGWLTACDVDGGSGPTCPVTVELLSVASRSVSRLATAH